MTRRPLLAALGLACAFGLAACSGSGATTAPTTAASTAPSAAATDAPAAGPCTTSTEAGTVNVTIEGFAFGPSTIEAKVGDVIAFTNKDSASHTATLDDDGCTTAVGKSKYPGRACRRIEHERKNQGKMISSMII